MIGRIVIFSKILKLSIICSIFMSCAPQVIGLSEVERIIEIDELKNDRNIYLAWNQSTSLSRSSDDDYGIGGTGISDDDLGIGGTGIVGTISGFGSIIVNGIHIDYEPMQNLESPLGELTAANLSIGHVVAVKAETVKDKLVAKKIIQQIALVGKVEAIDTLNRRIKVSGENVSILENKESNSLSFNDISIGEWIAISGMRDSDTLYATHVANQRSRAFSLVSGNVTDIKNDKIIVDHKFIFNTPRKAVTNFRIGDFVTIDKIDEETKIKSVKPKLTRIYGTMFDEKVNRTSVEGFFNSKKFASKRQNNPKKPFLTRQVVFTVKNFGSESKVIGAVQLDKERKKKLDFEMLQKNIQNVSEKNSLLKKNFSSKYEMKRENQKQIDEKKAEFKTKALNKKKTKNYTKAVKN